MGIGCITGKEIIVFKLKRNQPALCVVFGNIHSVENGKRLFLCENCRSGVAFSFGIVPVLVVAVKLKVNLPLLKLCFLEAEDVRVKGAEYLRKALLDAGSDSVNVP